MAGAARSIEEDRALMGRREGKLGEYDKAAIGRMIRRGDRIQDVAYWFGVSPSTVHKYRNYVGSMPNLDIPPPGPYALVQREVLVDLGDTPMKQHAALAAQKLLITELEALIVRYRGLVLQTRDNVILSA